MKRSFRVMPVVSDGELTGWRWECTLCEPRARGMRYGPDAYRKVLRISLPYHYRVRWQHHLHVQHFHPR